MKQAWQIELRGKHLVEASAGTGKTWTIAMLYLRLILEQGLHPEEILVLTFTEAAATDLRIRLAQRCREALQWYQNSAAADSTLQTYLEARPHGDRDQELLQTAIRELDTMAVYTIHGFCQRVLGEFSYSLDFPASAEFCDAAPSESQALHDVLRRESELLPPELQLELERRSPEDWLKVLRQVLGLPGILRDPPVKECHARELVTAYAQLTQAWPELHRCAHTHADACFTYLANHPARDKTRANSKNLLNWFAKLRLILNQNTMPPLGTFFKAAENMLEQKIGERWHKEPFEADKLLRHLWDFDSRRVEFLELREAHAATLFNYCLKHLPLQAARQRQAAGCFSFQDLSNKLADALKGEHAGAICQRLQRRFPTVLVDEFQDTDPQQYHIIHTLFEATTFLVLVGDPKQSIYGFRGGDIYTYAHARRRILKHSEALELQYNFRSDGRLVQVFNQLFAESDWTFRNKSFRPASLKLADKTFSHSCLPSTEASFTSHLVPEELWDKGKTQVRQYCIQSCANEISRVLNQPLMLQQGEHTEAVCPEDCAVLVRTNYDAELVQQALDERGIPSLKISRESIFASTEAQAILHLLFCLNAPTQSSLMLAMLAGPLCPLDEAGIKALRHNSTDLGRYSGALQHAAHLCHNYGLAAGLPGLLEMLQVERALLKTSRGEHRLSIFRQLQQELLEMALQIPRLDSLIQHWQTEMQKQENSSPTHQPQLESDEPRVAIVTIHSSKGLEYPLVFCPTLWGDSIKIPKAPADYHDGSGRRHVDFASSELEQHLDQQLEENLADGIRLFYVALTRARHQLQIWLARPPKVKSRQISPLASALLAPKQELLPFTQLETLVKESTRSDWLAALEHLKQMCTNGAVKICDPDEDGSEHKESLSYSRPDKTTTTSRELPQAPGRCYWTGSFSSLSQHGSQTSMAGEVELPSSGETAFRLLPALELELPAGPVFGNMLHQLYETTPFNALALTEAGCRSAEEDLQERCQQALQQNGFNPEQAPQLAQLICRSLRTPLPEAAGNRALVSYAPAVLTHEYDFLMPLQRFRPAELIRLLEKYNWPGAGPDALNWREQLDFSELKGFLRGYIDLLYYDGQRYHLLDWKSNWLGKQCSDYAQDSLRRCMAQANYYLQALLYALALHRSLALQSPAYDPHKDLGSMTYLFVRGVGLQQEPQEGIWSQEIPVQMILELNAQFKGTDLIREQQ